MLARRALAMEAAICLVGARLALLLVPFSWLARRWGAFVSATDPRVPAEQSAGAGRCAERAVQISAAVTTASRRLPFQTLCLPRAMAARWMLQRRRIPSIMHFGAFRATEQPFGAHAWLEAEGVEVTGYPLGPELVEIGCFLPEKIRDRRR